MKRILSITLAIFMLLLLIPTSIAEETEPTVLPSAKIGDQYSQTLVKDFPDTGVQPFTLSKGELPRIWVLKQSKWMGRRIEYSIFS